MANKRDRGERYRKNCLGGGCVIGLQERKGGSKGCDSGGLEFNSSTTKFLNTFVSVHLWTDPEFCVSGGK